MEGIMIAITTILIILSAVGLGVSCFLLYKNYRLTHPKEEKPKKKNAKITRKEFKRIVQMINSQIFNDECEIGKLWQEITAVDTKASCRLDMIEEYIHGKEEKK